MGSLPPAKAGVGSAVNDTTRQTGGALGVAVIGSIFALRYHAAASGIPGIPAAAQAQIRDSIGKALEAARQLPAAQQQLVRATVNHAYIVSMRVAYAVGAAVILAAAFVSWRWLPARRAGGTNHRQTKNNSPSRLRSPSPELRNLVEPYASPLVRNILSISATCNSSLRII